MLKEKYPDLKIVLAEPEDAGLLASGIATERKEDGAPVASHPAFKPHPIQGWCAFASRPVPIPLALALSVDPPSAASRLSSY